MTRKEGTKLKSEISDNSIVLDVDASIYPLDAILGTCYVFIDNAYIFLSGNHRKTVQIHIKGKKRLARERLERLVGEFQNELLNQTLRIKVAKNNKKIREYIIGQALLAAAPEEKRDEEEEEVSFDEEIEKELEAILEEEGDLDYLEDPLGIAIPWEEKYGKESDKTKGVVNKKEDKKKPTAGKKKTTGASSKKASCKKRRGETAKGGKG